ncbi:hypothetical protein [Mesorhizobium sp. SP-1A]|uniref:hypothetical protein n=1 Tax=Mesorhizobium sp. SP-1A TaxID=3077840 RepID=UPI0028F6F737|nr:hypothetical protein [Mesorhizobium sp. SP-1A]
MRSFTSKIIAAAALLAALPLSGAYAAHRHHTANIDTQAITASVPMDKEGRAVFEQLQGVEQGIAEARETGKISAGQARDLMMQAEGIRHAAWSGDRSVLAQVNDLDQQLQDDTGQGFYFGGGADGGYYPNG